jgi:hypothetical protein
VGRTGGRGGTGTSLHEEDVGRVGAGAALDALDKDVDLLARLVLADASVAERCLEDRALRRAVEARGVARVLGQLLGERHGRALVPAVHLGLRIGRANATDQRRRRQQQRAWESHVERLRYDRKKRGEVTPPSEFCNGDQWSSSHDQHQAITNVRRGGFY